MKGLVEVAAAAAILAIGFLPYGECVKGSASTSTLLWALPVTLTQVKEQPSRRENWIAIALHLANNVCTPVKDRGSLKAVHFSRVINVLKETSYVEIPCQVIQLIGPIPASETVKLTGSGWSHGPLEFLVGQQRGNEPDQAGDSAVGSQVAAIVINPPAAGDEDENNPNAGKILLTEHPLSPTEQPTVKEILLPIHSPEFGFMFICSAGADGQTLKCQVSGYNNKQDHSTGKWETVELELRLPAGTDNLRFAIQAHGQNTPKRYGTTGLRWDTQGVSLGCEAEAASAEQHTPEQETENEENEVHGAAQLPTSGYRAEAQPQVFQVADYSSSATPPTFGGVPQGYALGYFSSTSGGPQPGASSPSYSAEHEA